MLSIPKSVSLILLTYTLAITSSYSQELHDQNIKGHVKQLTISMYQAENVKIDPAHLDWKAVSKYNNKSQITEHSHFNRKGRLEYKDIYQYNDQGLLSKVINEAEGIITNIEEIKYDTKGNRIEYRSLDENGKLKYRITYRVNEQGQLVEENSFEQDDVLKFRIVYAYDSNGNNVESTTYDSTAHLLRIWRQKFDSRKNIIEYSLFGPDNNLIEQSTNTYTYHPSGAKKSETNYKNGAVMTKETFDVKGFVSESILYSGVDDEDILSKELFKYTKFDPNGNWQQLSRHEAGSERLIIREIDYY